MKSSEIVKAHASRSQSTRHLLQSQTIGKSQLQHSLNNSRDLSSDRYKSKPHQNFEVLSSATNFIRPKPSNHPLKISNSQRRVPGLLENFQTNKEISTIQEIVSKFSLKSIEMMKQDFNNNEVIYTQFLGIMAEIDEMFEKNPMLQFSISRAREVFKLYLSRPGQVLLTLKKLPNILGKFRISQKIISQSVLAYKVIDATKIKGVAKDVFELVCAIIAEKKSNHMGKTFVYKKFNQRRLKTHENLVTEEKTFDISIMDLHTVPNDSDCRSISPVPVFDSEDYSDYPQRLSNRNKSTKSRMIEQLYLKLNALPDQQDFNQSFKLATFGNKEPEDSYQEEPKKPVKKNISIPGYMRALKRDESEKKLNSTRRKNKENIKKEEWEEKRYVIITQLKKKEDFNKKQEIKDEIKQRQKEKIEMQEYLTAKENNENKERRAFREEERKETLRIKQIEKIREYNELMDDIERNKLKVKMNK